MGQISVDLTKAHASRQYGDLLAIYTWVNDERALTLIPAYRKNAAWYIVCESAAYKYDDRKYLQKQCMKAAEVLGMEPSPNNWIKLATIIHDGLPDLIEMPSAPPQALSKASVGEMQLLANGQRMTGQEVHRPLDEGVTYG